MGHFKRCVSGLNSGDLTIKSLLVRRYRDLSGLVNLEGVGAIQEGQIAALEHDASVILNGENVRSAGFVFNFLPECYRRQKQNRSKEGQCRELVALHK